MAGQLPSTSQEKRQAPPLWANAQASTPPVEVLHNSDNMSHPAEAPSDGVGHGEAPGEARRLNAKPAPVFGSSSGGPSAASEE